MIQMGRRNLLDSLVGIGKKTPHIRKKIVIYPITRTLSGDSLDKDEKVFKRKKNTKRNNAE